MAESCKITRVRFTPPQHANMSSMALGMHLSGPCGRIADTGGVSKEGPFALPYYHFTLASKNLQMLSSEQLVLIQAGVAGSVR